MNSQEVKEMYNGSFWSADGQPQFAMCELMIRVGERTLHIDQISLHPSHTIDSIFKNAHAHFASVSEPIRDAFEIQAIHESLPLQGSAGIEDVDLVEHQGKRYIVERISEDMFSVKNETGTEISTKSPTARAVIKKYKEQFS